MCTVGDRAFAGSWWLIT